MEYTIDMGITPLLYKVAHKCILMQNEKLKDYSISAQQAALLGMIVFLGKDNGINQKTISKEMQVKESSVSSLVKTMIKNGFIFKEQSKEDGRNYIIKLTDKGNEIIEVLKNTKGQIEKEIYGHLSEEEKDRLIKTLIKLV